MALQSSHSCPSPRRQDRYAAAVNLLTLRRAAHASPIAIALLVVSNLVPLAGVLLWGWDLATIVALYWLENGVVGAFALAKIGSAQGVEPAPGPVIINGRPVPLGQLMNPMTARVVLMPFFAFHYGMFWLVHGVFVWFALPEIWAQMGAGTGSPSLSTILWALPILVLSHGASFLFNWWWGGERRASTPSREMQAPYGRVVVLHITIVLGAFAVAALGAPIGALVIMVVLKTVADLGAHLAERERADVRARTGGVALTRNPGKASIST
jgi:hypothetical protein